MRKLFYLSMIATSLMLTACNKGAFSSQLRFLVSNEYGTRAVLNGIGESGLNIAWEEGDFIEYNLEVYLGSIEGLLLDTKKALDKVEGRIVYENGSWITYEARGSSFKQVDYISIRSSKLECVVRSRFHYKNPRPDPFVCVWEQRIPFSEGEQTVLVKLPVGDKE